MRAFDITDFTAEIDGVPFAVSVRRRVVSAPDDAARPKAIALRHELEALAASMRSNMALRHCDLGYAFAKQLKDEGAVIRNLKREFHPADAVF